MGREWLDKYTFRARERERKKKPAPDLMVQKQQSEAAVVQKLIDPIAVPPRAYSLSSLLCSSFSFSSSSSLTLLPMVFPVRLLLFPHHFHLILFPSLYLHLFSPHFVRLPPALLFLPLDQSGRSLTNTGGCVCNDELRDFQRRK